MVEPQSKAVPLEAWCKAPPALPGGPVSVIFAESRYMLAETARHMRGLGAPLMVLAHSDLPALEDATVLHVDAATPFHEAMARLIRALAGRWIAWCYNGEFLFYPWCESRRIGDLTEFLSGERRRALFGYVLDLYDDPLPGAEDDPAAAGLHFDTKAFHAFPREEGWLDVFGGLGWRFEGMIPAAWQAIGRTAAFRADPLHLPGPEMRFETLDYASVACPWHHNPTGAVMSLRRSRALFANPGFEAVRGSLYWSGSTAFTWSSRQLLELGMIEPGQWF